MCTVTMIPLGGPGGFRLAFNRDELRSRAPALPPRVQRFEARQAVMPIDPVSGGTWIAVNDAGLIFALLNGNAPPHPGQVSRGTIIPRLLGSDTADDATTAAMTLPFNDYDAFWLLVVDRSRRFELGWNRETVSLEIPQTAAPFMTTSSSLGDVVQKPRRALYEEMFAGGGPAEVQDAFHRHRWPDSPEISVDMSRAEARTVSRTVITLDENEATLVYEPSNGAPSIVTLPRTHR